MLVLFLAAFAVGFDNLAVSIAIGLTPISRANRIKISLVFGAFESSMPLIGLAIGHQVASAVGGWSRVIGATLLIGMGTWALVSAYRGGDHKPVRTAGWALLITGLAISLDNLVVGFGLGVDIDALWEAVVIFASVSIVMCLIGIEFGRRLGAMFESAGEYLAGGVLVAVGGLIGAGVL